MAQGVLSFQYKEQGSVSRLTGLAGLPAYLDLAQAAGLGAAIRRHLKVRDEGSQGWSDHQVVMALILLNLAGGDYVADTDRLEVDAGLCQVLRKVEHHGLPRRQRRELERRWHRGRGRTFPSASSVFRYLAAFHDLAEEARRPGGTAFIPAPNEHLPPAPATCARLTELTGILSLLSRVARPGVWPPSTWMRRWWAAPRNRPCSVISLTRKSRRSSEKCPSLRGDRSAV